MEFVIVRFVDKNLVEIMKLESLPEGAHSTGRTLPAGKEFLVGSQATIAKFMDIINKI